MIQPPKLTVARAWKSGSSGGRCGSSLELLGFFERLMFEGISNSILDAGWNFLLATKVSDFYL
jgi:hypothetical protein